MNICTFNQQQLSANGTRNTATNAMPSTLPAILIVTIMIGHFIRKFFKKDKPFKSEEEKLKLTILMIMPILIYKK